MSYNFVSVDFKVQKLCIPDCLFIKWQFSWADKCYTLRFPLSQFLDAKLHKRYKAWFCFKVSMFIYCFLKIVFLTVQIPTLKSFEKLQPSCIRLWLVKGVKAHGRRVSAIKGANEQPVHFFISLNSLESHKWGMRCNKGNYGTPISLWTSNKIKETKERTNNKVECK